jgi:hypothetical protein
LKNQKISFQLFFFIKKKFFAEGEEESNKEMPIFVMFVDLTGGEDFLESVKNSILAVWEVIPPSAYFGIITFSDKIGIFDLKSENPHVKYIFIPPSDPCSLGIEELFSFNNIFVMVNYFIFIFVFLFFYLFSLFFLIEIRI